MPDVGRYATEDAWMEACVPVRLDEGMEQDQAVASCLSQWRERDKSVPEETRGWATLTVKSLDADQRLIEGWASKPEVDRIGDVVEPLGCSMKIPMPLLWAHKHDEPVGHVIAANTTKDGISIRARIAQITDPGPLKDSVDRAWQAVKAGLCQGLSIGFKPREFEPIETGFRYTKSDILELSLVVIPALASATITMIKSLDQALLAPPRSVPIVTLLKDWKPQLPRKTLVGTLDEAPLFDVRMRGWHRVGRSLAVPLEWRNGLPLYQFQYEVEAVD